MKIEDKFRRVLAALPFLLLAGLALAQQSDRALIVNGKTVPNAVVEMQGRTYVDIRLLSDAMGATLTVDPSRVTLTTPAQAANTARAAQQTPPPPPDPGLLSTNFRASAIAALSEMREWQGVVESVIQSGVPIAGTWPRDYRDRAEASVNQARVRATTTGDQGALQLLQNEFAMLRNWSDGVVADRNNLNAARSIDPNALSNDAALKKIADCSQFLGGMASAGLYSDDTSCH